MPTASLPTANVARAVLPAIKYERAGYAVQEELTIAELKIVPQARRVILSGGEVTLTRGQFDLLLSLARAYNRVKTRDALYAEVHARAYGGLDRALDVQVSCLRRKLGDDPRRPRFIRTVRSAGYMLVHPDHL